MNHRIVFILAYLFVIHFGVASKNLPEKSNINIESKNLYEVFQNPESKYRPFVRWWWNGLRLNEKEILHELDVMKQMGIGGVEINSIRFPDEADTLGYKVMPYLSDEWVNMVKVAAKGCKDRGMVCDMIAGSGWPFGGEFLPEKHQLQMLTVETMKIDGGTQGVKVSVKKSEVLDRVDPPIMSKNRDSKKELMYIRLMPEKVDTFTPGTSFDYLADKSDFEINVPAGKYVLYFFVKMVGYMSVIEGAPGACGPVLNHFDKNAVIAYLNRLSSALPYKSPELKNAIRAAFVDSFELEGANWSDSLLKEWETYYGYSLLPYLPYVIRKVGSMGEPLPDDYGCNFSEKVKKEVIERVRNDFEHFQIKLFQENFIDTFNKWCHDNGIQSRVQAYGRALHPIESSMYIDIPECETWFRDGLGTEYPDKEIYLGHAHSMINKFVASGSLLAGNGIVSCEEITNTGEIFQSTLEEIKIAGDMSNISGVNHSILHGFNYSPVEAPFPGWIKFGEYFSEKNTMYPYYRLWTDYKARLSAVLQNSIPQADIAILPPLEDMWSELGQQRDPYPVHVYPDYAHDLWQNLHQNGNGCDYVSENIIKQSKIKGGKLSFGPRSYKTLILMEVKSLSPETAGVIERFVASGGRVICIGCTPWQSIGMNDFEARSRKVNDVISRIQVKYPQRFVKIASPRGSLTEWYRQVQDSLSITPYVKIDNPSKWVFCNYYKSGDKDIFFITNFSRVSSHHTMVKFPESTEGKNAWIWLPETGERYRLSDGGSQMDIMLRPSESKLIVFDSDAVGDWYTPMPCRPENAVELTGKWKVEANHFDGSRKEFYMDTLTDFNSLPFPWLKTFAGELSYTLNKEFANPDSYSVIDLGSVRGVSEVYVNGEKLGTGWYGDHRFRLKGKMKKGNNIITIKVITPLGNYANSLKTNKTAKRYAHSMKSLGLEHGAFVY